MAFDTESYLRKQKTFVDKTLDEILPPEDARPQVIHSAMRYSVLAGGKRIRPFSTRRAGLDTLSWRPRICIL